MNVDDLRSERDDLDQVPLQIDTAELCDRYERLYTGAIDNVLREYSLVDNVLPHRISPLRDEMTVAGIAFTISSAPNPTLEGEMDTRAEMLDELHDHAVPVWDTSRDDVAAHWGEVMTTAAKERGCRGCVIDGGIRDTRQVLEQEFPVFHEFRTSRGSLSRAKITDYQETIKIGSTIIKPGDIIFADIDGAVVVPRNIAVEVLERAEEVQREDKEVRADVQTGRSATEIVDDGGYF